MDIKSAIKPSARLVIINHGSSVPGIIQPIGEIMKICREKGVAFALD